MAACAVIDRERLRTAFDLERRRFESAHPRSRALYEGVKKSLLGGVPMNWMLRWAGGFPLFVAHGEGAHFSDVDGHRYLDLCLGDTGSMTGHAPAPAVAAVSERVRHGVTFMLPTEDAVWVGEELTRRFGLPYWQLALTATDANRFAVRLARLLTGRPKILAFNGCYHGSVDETFVPLEEGVAASRSGNLGPPVDPTLTTKVVEFNDRLALEAALAPGDRLPRGAARADPPHGNAPDPGRDPHAVRGPGRNDPARRLDAGRPDVGGKAIASGIPAAVYGVSAEVARRIEGRIRLEESDTGGIGGTLAGKALSLAAMRATLESVLTEASFARTIPLAERLAAGVEDVIARERLPWIVKRLGCRVEYWFRRMPPRNGTEAAEGVDSDLEAYMYLAALNRGILLTPFHNMVLVAPDATEADMDRHTVFAESVEAIVS